MGHSAFSPIGNNNTRLETGNQQQTLGKTLSPSEHDNCAVPARKPFAHSVSGMCVTELSRPLRCQRVRGWWGKKTPNLVRNPQRMRQLGTFMNG